MWSLVLIGLGGAAGAVLRYLVNLWSLTWYAGSFPLGTLLVNVAGSLLIGIGWSTIGNDTTRLLLLTGLLGGFTTFSSFSLETVRLWEDGQMTLALWNILLNNLSAILACMAGYWIGKMLHA